MSDKDTKSQVSFICRYKQFQQSNKQHKKRDIQADLLNDLTIEKHRDVLLMYLQNQEEITNLIRNETYRKQFEHNIESMESYFHRIDSSGINILLYMF